MTLELQREASTPDGRTYGHFHIDGQPFCLTLEDTIRERATVPVAQWKIAGSTAIPAGRYLVTVVWSPHFQRKVPMLHSVPGFDAIEIHPGNTIADTRGCILLGYVKTFNGISHSRQACDDFTARLVAETTPVFLTIHNPAPEPQEPAA